MEQNILEQIAELRHENYSYQFIADTLGMPMNTVKSICRRQGFIATGSRKTKAEKQNAPLCKNCGIVLVGGRDNRLFCSNNCRAEWWKNNKKVEIIP